MRVDPEDFEDVHTAIRTRLTKVLVAHYGREIATELVADVTAYAWEHRDRLAAMDNPVGYLYRVAQSKSRRYSRWNAQRLVPAARSDTPSLPDSELQRQLDALPMKQRMCVVLVHGFQWSYEEAAATLGLSVPAVRNQLHRGMKTLRSTVAAMEDE